MSRRQLSVLGALVLCGCASGGGPRTHGLTDGGVAPRDAAPGDRSDAASPTRSDAGGAAVRRDAGVAPGRADAGGGPTDTPGAPVHMEMYSGDGLTAIGGWPAGDPMKVLVTDASGRPVPDVDVRWAVVEGDGGLVLDSSATDHSSTNEHGIAHMGYRGAFLASYQTTLRSTVRATSTAGHVDFVAISTNGGSGYPVPAGAQLVEHGELYRDVGSGAPGAVLAGAIEVLTYIQTGPDSGRPLEGVGVRLVDPTHEVGGPDAWADGAPQVSCANAVRGRAAGGMVFSDAMGRALCDVRLPMTPGEYRFSVRVGGSVEFSGVRATVR